MSRIKLFGFEIDALSMAQTVDRIYDWVRQGQRNCRFVVTPNVDHAVLYQHHAGLRRAYARASLVLVDGAPVIAAAKMLGRPLPGRVPGSDLAPELFAAAEKKGGLRVFLLGAAPGVAQRAAEKITARWKGVEIVGCYSPPLGFEKDAEENARILRMVHEASPDVLIVGLGAPKQELWVDAHRHQLAAGVTLCIGAAIDFLAGEKRRAPHWMRRAGLEWLFRMASEPRRLAKRYARDMWLFPQLVVREWASTIRPTRDAEPT